MRMHSAACCIDIVKKSWGTSPRGRNRPHVHDPAIALMARNVAEPTDVAAGLLMGPFVYQRLRRQELECQH